MNPSELGQRHAEITDRVARAARGPAPRLIAVSKGQPAAAVHALYQLGHRDFGENYVQELVAKAAELQKLGCADIRWHFQGHLQTNKVKALLPFIASLLTIDSERLALEVSKRWIAGGRPGRLPVFIEVNIDGEASKAGVAPADVRGLAERISALPGLELRGLMCIPAPEDEPSLRVAFARLRELELACRPFTGGELSMGMSDDFELAIAEGATQVRVGTALFGARRV